MTKRRGAKRSRPARTAGAGAEAASTRDEKRERRLERQLREANERQRAARRARVRRILATTAVIAVLAAAGWFLLRPDPEVAGVERPANRGRGHVAAPSFDTPTPTSGPHLASAPRCTSYTEALEPGLAVHALEHGAVVIWYAAGDDELRGSLEDAVSRWSSHVIVSPQTGLDDPIVATAWNRRASYQEAGSRLEEFIDTYRKRGPEKVACEA